MPSHAVGERHGKVLNAIETGCRLLFSRNIRIYYLNKNTQSFILDVGEPITLCINVVLNSPVSLIDLGIFNSRPFLLTQVRLEIHTPDFPVVSGCACLWMNCFFRSLLVRLNVLHNKIMHTNIKFYA